MSQALQLNPSLELLKALIIACQIETVQQQHAQLRVGKPTENAAVDALQVKENWPAEYGSDAKSLPKTRNWSTKGIPPKLNKLNFVAGAVKGVVKNLGAKQKKPACSKSREKGLYSAVCQLMQVGTSNGGRPDLVDLRSLLISRNKSLVFKIDTGAGKTVITKRQCLRFLSTSP